MLSNAVGRLRVISLLEAGTFLLLLGCSVLKRTNDWETGVQVMGPVHGVLFVLYVLLVFDVRARLAWPTPTTAKVLVAAVIPFAPFVVERWLRDQPIAAERRN